MSTRHPTTLQHPLEKQVTSSCTYKDQNFFWFTSDAFLGDPSQSCTGSYVLFFFEEATCESSTIIGLLYAHEALIVARRYDVPRDWLWDAWHIAGVRWGSRCKGFCSKEGLHYRFTWSTRNMTINLIHELETPWGFHTRAVLCSSAGLMSRKKVLVQGLLWVRKVWFAFAQQTFALETFGERRKASYFEKPRVLHLKFGGACTTYYLVVPKVWETGWEIGFPCSQERAR